MNTVPVIFARSHKVGSVLLRGLMWSKWSHCGIVDGDTVIEATLDGVDDTPLVEVLARSALTEIVHIPCRNPRAVIAAARTQLDKPYDIAGVLGLGARRCWQDDDKWFCSELVAWAFTAAGSPIMRSKAWRITPQMIYVVDWNRADFGALA